MSIPDLVSYQANRSRFRRFVYKPAGFDEADLKYLVAGLAPAGITLENQQLTSSIIVLDARAGTDTLWIETRREEQFDHLVDLLFWELLDAYPDAEARCSDCYACCSTSSSWLVKPQFSKSCITSQRRKPSEHFVRSSLPEDPLFAGETPLGFRGDDDEYSFGGT